MDACGPVHNRAAHCDITSGPVCISFSSRHYTHPNVLYPKCFYPNIETINVMYFVLCLCKCCNQSKPFFLRQKCMFACSLFWYFSTYSARVQSVLCGPSTCQPACLSPSLCWLWCSRQTQIQLCITQVDMRTHCSSSP